MNNYPLTDGWEGGSARVEPCNFFLSREPMLAK